MDKARDTNVEHYTETADTFEKCIAKINKNFGSNYLIMQRRTIRTGGFLGFFEREGVEITFAPINVYNKNQQSAIGPIKSAPKNFEEERKKILAASPAKNLPNPQVQEVLEEVRALKEQITQSRFSQSPEEHESIKRIGAMMEANEFTPRYIKIILDKVRKEFSLQELDNFEEVQNSVVDWIGDSIKIYNQEHMGRPQIIVLVGPTGVGKTTTIAKFAANYIFASTLTPRPLKVRMVTIDNYRIAAKQQLEIYASYMNLPVSVVENPEDLKKILAYDDGEKDVVLIDTIGHSPKDFERIAKMRELLDIKGSASEFYLTLSASTKTSDLREIIQHFEIFSYQSIVITKFDETNRIGNIISVLDEKNKSVAFITTGQKVPQDIEKASVVRFLMQLTDFKINRNRIEARFGSYKR